MGICSRRSQLKQYIQRLALNPLNYLLPLRPRVLGHGLTSGLEDGAGGLSAEARARAVVEGMSRGGVVGQRHIRHRGLRNERLFTALSRTSGVMIRRFFAASEAAFRRLSACFLSFSIGNTPAKIPLNPGIQSVTLFSP